MSGAQILQLVQSVNSPFLDQFFYYVTQLHNETFYILVLPVLFWLYDKRFTRYLISVFILGYWSNSVLKFVFDTVRPSAKAAELGIRVVHAETGTGPAFPSGHSQNPLMFWGALALQVNRKWFTVLATILVILTAYSRLYLGVHWPLDILGGWTIGILMLWGFYATARFWRGEGMSLASQMLWAVVIPVAALLIAIPVIPAEHAKDMWVIGGAWIGFGVGAALEQEFINFDPRRGSWLSQVIKVLVGIALVFGVKEGMKLVLPATGFGDLIRYSLVTLMATVGAPWLFHKVIAPPSGKEARAA